MGHLIQLDTQRTPPIGAYLATPSGTPRGGLVIVQEIFGVNAHMRQVVDRFAGLGFTAIAPAFFDHVEAGIELDYDDAGFARGKELVDRIGLDLAVEDVASAAATIASAGPVACIGYCWGGTVALLAAIRLGMPAVSYYGARNRAYLGEAADAKLQFHFGERDRSIPPDVVAEHRARLPDAEVYTYPAGHAFDRAVDPEAYDAPSAQLALERALAFLDRHLAGG